VRLISALAILLLISSCAHNRIRFVKSGPRQIVEVDHKNSDIFPVEEVHANRLPIETPPINSLEHLRDPNWQPLPPEYRTPLVQPQDTTGNENPKVTQEVYDQALDAQYSAKRASNMMVTAVALFASGFIPFLPGVGMIVSIGFLIAGAIFLRRARRSRYSTVEGERLEERAGLFQIIYLVLSAIVVLAITALILILLL
jgi:hypothetical protein